MWNEVETNWPHQRGIYILSLSSSLPPSPRAQRVPKCYNTTRPGSIVMQMSQRFSLSLSELQQSIAAVKRDGITMRLSRSFFSFILFFILSSFFSFFPLLLLRSFHSLLLLYRTRARCESWSSGPTDSSERTFMVISCGKSKKGWSHVETPRSTGLTHTRGPLFLHMASDPPTTTTTTLREKRAGRDRFPLSKLPPPCTMLVAQPAPSPSLQSSIRFGDFSLSSTH